MSLLSDKQRAAPKAVLLATPTLGMVSIYWHNAIMEVFRCGKPMNRAIIERQVKGDAIDAGRNALVTWALSLTDPVISHVFFVDDDVIIPSNALIRLLSHQRALVSGLYYAKTHTKQPLVLSAPYEGAPENWESGELVECYAHGMGCTLIERVVFEHIEPPWFKTTVAICGLGSEFKTQTEDVYFCEKAIAAGFQPTVDTGLECLHYDSKQDKAYPLDLWARVYGEPIRL